MYMNRIPLKLLACRHLTPACRLIPFLALVTLIVFTSCNRKNAATLNNIDSLIVVNDSCGQMMLTIDSIHILDSRKIFADNWKVINSLIDSIGNPDLIQNDTMWNYITMYENQDRSVKKLVRRYQRLMNVYHENKHQLTTLKESVRRNKIPEDSLQAYVSMEGLEVFHLQKETFLYMPDLRSGIAVLDSLHQYAKGAIVHYRSLKDAGKNRKK